MAIAMTSDVLTQGQIYDAADAVISQRLSQIKGVGGVNVNGSALPAVRVEINPLALVQIRHRAAGRARRDLERQRQRAQGRASRSDQLHYQIYTNDNARDAAPYRTLIIANRNGATGAPGRRRRRCSTCRTAPPRTSALTASTTASPRSSCTVFQQPGANIIEMVDAVKAELPVLKSSIDPKIDLVVTFDRSVTIRASLRQVEQTLMLAVAHGDPGGLRIPATAIAPR